jgi:hypothetical protein
LDEVAATAESIAAAICYVIDAQGKPMAVFEAAGSVEVER